MKEKLIQLFNNLNCVETRGENTIIMAGALTLLNQIIAECDTTKQAHETAEGV